MRLAPRIVLALGLLATAATIAPAQELGAPGWQLRLPSGGLIVTGAQRARLQNARLTALQVARTFSPRLAVTGTFGWARSRDLVTADRPTLDVFTSDVGVEGCMKEYFAAAPVSLRTFGGLGAGVRSYRYRSLDVAATHNLAGYVAAGGEVGMGRVALRVEARDYATGFKPLAGVGASTTRNDVVILAGVRFNRRPAEAR